VDLDKYFTGIDVVIHFAAITDATSSHDKKDEVEKVNYLGTERVAEACIRNGCKLIFPSTTSVYGVQSGIVDEDCAQVDLKPQSPYAESKIRAERLLESLGKYKGLKFVICRFGTIFGTSIGMRFHTAVNKFCWQASMGQSITVWRTALNQKRPYLGIEDAISAIKLIIKNEIFDNNIYNVVTTNTTVGDIINIIKKDITEIKIELVDTKIMNQLSYHVSGKKFEKHGFEYRSNIEQDINDTIKILKNACG
jgi:nucleoside-diphosphate-sugar epimerase